MDEISTSQQKIPLCILMVGLEERRQELVSNQPSLASVFELIDIAPWADDEAMDFYRNSFDSVSAKIDATDLRQLVRLAGGVPILAHEIGDAVWRTARGLRIDSKEVRKGILTAADLIGWKLVQPGSSGPFAVSFTLDSSKNVECAADALSKIGTLEAPFER